MFSLFEQTWLRRELAAKSLLAELRAPADPRWVLITSTTGHDSGGIPVRSEGALKGEGVLPLSGKDARGWDGYWIAYLGLLLDLAPVARPDHPREEYTLTWDDWTIDLWVLQIRHGDSPLYAERVTAPTGPGPAGAIRGLEREHTPQDVTGAHRGWRLLARLRRAVGGRPTGTRKGCMWTREDYSTWYREAVEPYARDGERLTLNHLAEAMAVSTDTARSRLREVGLPWPPEVDPEAWDPDPDE